MLTVLYFYFLKLHKFCSDAIYISEVPETNRTASIDPLQLVFYSSMSTTIICTREENGDVSRQVKKNGHYIIL